MNGRRKLGWVLGAAGAAMIASAVLVGPGVASATTSNPVTVDPGNVTTCAQVGFASSIQYNGSITSGTGGVAGLFTATVTTDRFVTISEIAPGVTFQAVVIKGGNAYNVYNPPVENMQSPLNGGNNVPALSHWFACYTYTPPVTSPPTTAPPTTAPPTTAPPTTAPPTTAPPTTAPPTTAPPTTAPPTTAPPTTAPPTTQPAATTTVLESETPTTTTLAPTTTAVASEAPTTTIVESAALPETGLAGGSQTILLGLALLFAGLLLLGLTRGPAKS